MAFDIRSQFSRFSKDMMALLHEEVYVVNILGAFSSALLRVALLLLRLLIKYEEACVMALMI